MINGVEHITSYVPIGKKIVYQKKVVIYNTITIQFVSLLERETNCLNEMVSQLDLVKLCCIIASDGELFFCGENIHDF